MTRHITFVDRARAARVATYLIARAVDWVEDDVRGETRVAAFEHDPKRDTITVQLHFHNELDECHRSYVVIPVARLVGWEGEPADIAGRIFQPFIDKYSSTQGDSTP